MNNPGGREQRGVSTNQKNTQNMIPHSEAFRNTWLCLIHIEKPWMGILWKYKTQNPVAIPEQDRTGLNRVDGAPLFRTEHWGYLEELVEEGVLIGQCL